MVKLKVRDFGPIRAGFGDFIDFTKITLFCGPQGSGKSTVTKLFSTLSWVEKKLFRLGYPLVTSSYTLDMLRKDLSWQGISDYLTKEAEFDFVGNFFHIICRDEILTITQVADWDGYEMPQIMYIPAERNFASIVRNALRVENLPESLVNLQVEFERAKKQYKRGYKLPANGFGFSFDEEKGESWILNDGATETRTPLHLASSGLQSIVPLLLISECLESKLSKDRVVNVDDFFKDATPQKRLNADQYFNLLRSHALDRTEEAKAIVRYLMPCTRFVNIVEEPEQNLYPDTQCEVIDRLLALANRRTASSLVVSTHSPYVVNHLQLVAQAEEVSRGIDVASLATSKLPIPLESLVSAANMRLYEMHLDGTITLSQTDDGYISDANPLNRTLAEFNDRYARILEMGNVDA
jgi:energy-coupling factor transporter ATP-binding protein EcfA2